MNCSRRLFLLGSATTFAGAYLAACGSEPTAQIAATEVPVGSGIIVDGIIFAQPVEGEFKAFSAKCPHQGSTITKIEGSDAICTTHFSTFDMTTGEVVSGPSPKGLTEYEVAKDGALIKNVPA
ncbi:iron-sulfur protein [Corynebacterium phocae]|uniref:Iron-sulfur protein n=1 Tax=Corynebacterium phocae TaxID=161895 RepID=A0A1L7D678_9CORY|nr:Rieske (2Fe-2S) protein [Corynebacterium phocae]APT93541.1 iron-sulfur protein [Corynebacterium phocae]KAA8720627.1 Rieske (2Fe-2S) protein [Corynebacterium phocae]